MITTFKLINHYLNLDVSLFFAPSNAPTRGHHCKLYKSRCSRDVRYHMFSHRIINQWNSLPEGVVEVTNTSLFKNILDTYHSDILYTNDSYLL